MFQGEIVRVLVHCALLAVMVWFFGTLSGGDYLILTVWLMGSLFLSFVVSFVIVAYVIKHYPHWWLTSPIQWFLVIALFFLYGPPGIALDPLWLLGIMIITDFLAYGLVRSVQGQGKE